MNIADHSRIWIFQSNRAFNETELSEINFRFEDFLIDWNAHGAALLAAYEIIDQQFIVVAVDEDQATASGCSIDKLTKTIKALEEKYQFGFLDRMNIAYQEADQVKIERLTDFKSKVKNGEITENVIVYNNGLSNLGSFKSEWKLPLKKSWAKNLIPN